MGTLRARTREGCVDYESEDWNRDRNGMLSIVVAGPTSDGLRSILEPESAEHPELDRGLAQLELRFGRTSESLRKGLAVLQERRR